MPRSSREDGAAGLHHTREVANMRSEYDCGRAEKRRDVSDISSQGSNSSSERSYQARSTRSTMSEKSYQTLATEPSVDYFTSKPSRDHPYPTAPKTESFREQHTRHRDSAPQSGRPLVHQSHDEHSERDQPPQYHYFDDRAPQESPSGSVQSFTSTIADEEELDQQLPEFEVPQSVERMNEQSNVIAATPSDFSQLFPSSRTLLVHHDDSTDDGNMNLRVDTEVSIDGSPWDMTLFHLRLQDLKSREFSLRRYCRDSGREVCHSSRKQQKAAGEKRPGFSRSLSNALTNMRSHSGQKTPTLSRNDSGYASGRSGDAPGDPKAQASGQSAKPAEQPLTDTIRLEFSNYAQAGIKRVGTKGNKRYEFEYWNVHYSWRRVVQRDDGIKKISYYLTKSGSDAKLAYITPVALDEGEAQIEQDKGGWIPPCRMRITDKSILKAQKDLSDVIVACGLMSLVDDAIRTRLESQSERSMLIPSSVQYIGPKRLINEMFNRKDSGSRPPTRPPSSRQSSRPSTSGSGYTASGTTSGLVRGSA